MKKIFSLLLLVTFLMSFFPILVSAINETEVPNGYIGIYDKDDLMAIHSNTSSKYILMNDIVFDESDFGSTYNDGMGWIPFESFSGIFDGNGHKISNLRISGEQDKVGLFGTLTASALVKNLTLENVYIDVEGDYVGGICGQIQMDKAVSGYRISNCKVSGSISGNNYVGGICGYIDIGVTENCYIIEKSCNIASVNGTQYVGGLAGYHYGYAYYLGYAGARGSRTYIGLSMNMGSVTAISDAGGLIGKAYERQDGGPYGSNYGYLYLNDCFNSGSVSADRYSGGIIGNVYRSKKDEQVTLTNIYNAGKVTANSATNFGAICGVDTLMATNVYYVNSTVSNATSEIGQSVTADKLKLVSMGSNWTTSGNKHYIYPELIGVDMIFQLNGEISIKGTPECGSTLEVDLSKIQPNAACVRVEWIINDFVVGEETSYEIREEDMGKQISVKIYGIDDCIGSVESTLVDIPVTAPDVEDPEKPDDEINPPAGDKTPDEDTNTSQKKNHEECNKNANGWKRFWNAFANLFRILFGLPEKCVCGDKLVY